MIRVEHRDLHHGTELRTGVVLPLRVRVFQTDDDIACLV